MEENGNDLMKRIEIILNPLLTKEQLESVTYDILKEMQRYDIYKTKAKDHDYTDDELLEQFGEALDLENKAKKTIGQYKYALKRFQTFTKKPFLDTTTKDVRAYILYLKRESKLSEVTQNNYKHYLSSFFSFCEDEGYIDENPIADKIGKIKEHKIKEQPFTDVELEHIKQSLRNDREKALVHVLLSTGMRINEACNLKIEDISPMGTPHDVHIVEGKGAKERMVYMDSVAYDYMTTYIKKRRHPSEYVFNSERGGGKLTPSAIQREMRALQEKCGVQNIHPHRFRRTMANKLLQSGMDVTMISKLLGHENIQTTLTYLNISDGQIKNMYNVRRRD